MTDLDKLIAAVGSGSATYADFTAFACDGIKMPNDGRAHAAYRGDLNAAKALHEALLPGWEWDVSWVGAMVGGPDALIPETSEKEFYVDNAENPARAWLIAVLKAYRSVAK